LPNPKEMPRASDWISRKRWLNEEERLAEWFWLDALGVPPDSNWLDHGIRQGEIPKWLSEEAVIKTKSQIAELGPRPGQVFQPGARYIWLKETWLPFLLAKREELTRTQASKLLKIDQEAREEAEQAKLEAELRKLRKQIPVEEPEQFFVKARELRKKSRDVLQPSWRLKKQSLRWVPKNSVNAEEGTSVPEAVGILQEEGLD